MDEEWKRRRSGGEKNARETIRQLLEAIGQSEPSLWPMFGTPCALVGGLGGHVASEQRRGYKSITHLQTELSVDTTQLQTDRPLDAN